MSKIPRDVIDHFASIPLFSRASKKGLQTLAMGTDEVVFQGGCSLFREGDSASQLFGLISGVADVYRGGQQVARRLLLTGSQFQDVLDNEPWVAKAVIRNLATRIDQMVQSTGG